MSYLHLCFGCVQLCEQDPRCKRLQLSDLLVAPIQHVTKYPLLLKDIRERTEDSVERASLNATLQAVEVALSKCWSSFRSEHALAVLSMRVHFWAGLSSPESIRLC